MSHVAFLRAVLPRFGPIAESMWPGIIEIAYVARILRDAHHEPQSATFGWIVRGLAREYYVGFDGREHNRAFFMEEASFGYLGREHAQLPPNLWTQALEDVEALCITSSDFSALCDSDPRWHVFARRCAEQCLASTSVREHELLMLSAELRYRRALARQPELASRVRLYHLASYLGITPEHLSRIRRGART